MNKNYALAFLAILFWGTLPPVSKLLLNGTEPPTVVFLTALIATITLLIYNCFRGKIKEFRKLEKKDWIRLFFLGFVGYFIYNAAYYLGIDSLTAQEATVINYLWPLMTVIFSCFVLGEKFTPVKAAAAVLSFGGVVIVTTKGDLTSFAGISTAGVLACLTAAVSYGAYGAFNKKYDYDQDIATLIYFGITALFSGIWVLMAGTSLTITLPQFGGLLWMGVLDSAAGYLLWNTALNRGDTAKIANLAYITPFLAIILSCLILKEPFDIHTLLGLVLIIGGIFIQMKGGRTQEQKIE